MIDVENEVYTMLAQALRAEFPGIDVASEVVSAPASFPHVSCYMGDDYTPIREQTGKNTETFAVMMFQIDIYSNKEQGRKTECKNISKFISDFLFRHNFIRTANIPTPNMNNTSIYRITQRYRVASDGEQFYRR